MKLINKWTAGLFTAAVITAGSLALSSLATDEPTEPTPAVTTIAEAEETTESTIPTEPREKITFEYYTITEEAAASGWNCQTISRCDKNKMMVYIYDPAELGIHKFNMVANFEFIQADFIFVFVNKYNEFLGEETITVNSDDFDSGAVIVIDNYPPGTKFVKFKDIINIQYKYEKQ